MNELFFFFLVSACRLQLEVVEIPDLKTKEENYSKENTNIQNINVLSGVLF